VTFEGGETLGLGPPGCMSGASPVWVWCPVNAEQATSFQHPSNIPTDEAAAKSCFIERLRGPRTARISRVTLLHTKGNEALIAEDGATRTVPKSMVLPFYEGLLLLQELESTQGQNGHIPANWCDDELRTVLEQERMKFKNGMLSGALYTEKRLVTTAVTGNRFIDTDEKEWSYRRENLRANDKATIPEGEEGGNFFRIREVCGYLPPWEAFCNEKCGFYQDFYQVRWEYPFSEIDYSRVENGCPNVTGATWEPDECLPAHLDLYRLSAKRAWIKKKRDHEQRDREQRSADEKLRKRLADGQSGSDVSLKRQRSSDMSGELKQDVKKEEKLDEKKPLVKLARTRRDGVALERDLFRHSHGHDFVPDLNETSLGGIRTGWPKQPQDYPPGYGVANPPGFCWEGCDCMDDQRPQRSWETNKAWLEDAARSAAANSVIETFSAQTRFVRRRGQVSKMCYFETAQNAQGDQTHSRAALDLAVVIERSVTEVLKTVPIHSLISDNDPVRFPARLVLSDELDYEPLRYDLVVPSNEQLPCGLEVGSSDGHLSAGDHSLAKAVNLRIDVAHAEGTVGSIPCVVTPERLMAPNAPWIQATLGVAQRFADSSVCPMEKSARAVLTEHLGELYDFRSQKVRSEKTLGEWLEVMARVLRMLRSTATANVILGTAHKKAAFNPAVVQPQTPPQ